MKEAIGRGGPQGSPLPNPAGRDLSARDSDFNALPYGFPAMVPADDGPVLGEVLVFPDPAAALRRLDHLEGFRPDGPRHYDRIVVETIPLDGVAPVRAWCYVYRFRQLEDLHHPARLVRGGDWAMER